LGADNLPMLNWRALVFLLLCWLQSARPMAAPAPVVAVDVGHGLKDSGALSARGRAEFDFNRDLAVHLTRALRSRTLQVREVNFDGQIGSLAQRPLAGLGSDLFVSVHHDSIDPEFWLPWTWRGRAASHTVVKRGFGLFVSSRNPDLATSLRCAVLMGRLLRRAGFESTPWHARKHQAADADNGVWYYDTLLVLGTTTLPAVLLEAGVIRHRDEELQLLNPTRQARMADALASATAACLSVSDGQTTRPSMTREHVRGMTTSGVHVYRF
jgi:N-acetylmuramoyl-L-alanine amidase